MNDVVKIKIVFIRCSKTNVCCIVMFTIVLLILRSVLSGARNLLVLQWRDFIYFLMFVFKKSVGMCVPIFTVIPIVNVNEFHLVGISNKSFCDFLKSATKKKSLYYRKTFRKEPSLPGTFFAIFFKINILKNDSAKKKLAEIVSSWVIEFRNLQYFKRTF